MTYLRNAKKKKTGEQTTVLHKEEEEEKRNSFPSCGTVRQSCASTVQKQEKKKRKGCSRTYCEMQNAFQNGKKKKMGKRGGMSICRDHHIETHAAAYQSAGSHRVPRRIAKYKTPRSHCNALNKQSEGATQRSTIKKQQQQLQVNH